MSTTTLLLPVVSAFTGWLIAFVAGILLQRSGAVRAKAQQALAGRAASLANGMINSDTLSASLRNPALLDTLKPSIEQHVDVFLQDKLKEKVPVLSVFIGGSTLDKIKAGLLEEIDLLLPEVIGQYADKLGAEIDVSAMVRDRIGALGASEFDQLLQPAVKPVVTYLQIIGAVVGLLVSGVCVLVLG